MFIYPTDRTDPNCCTGFKYFLLGVREYFNYLCLLSINYFEVVHSMHFLDKCTQFIVPCNMLEVHLYYAYIINTARLVGAINWLQLNWENGSLMMLLIEWWMWFLHCIKPTMPMGKERVPTVFPLTLFHHPHRSFEIVMWVHLRCIQG